MNVGEAKALLQQGGFVIKSETRLANNSGYQLKLTTGENVSVYDKGTLLVQGGSNPNAVRAVLGAPPAALSASVTPSTNRNVFVIYGHDQHAKTSLEAMLRRWGLNPLILDQLPSQGQTIIEKLEAYRTQVNFAVVLATPDDEGNKANHADEKSLRARQNVVLELGMMLALLGRSRVAILLKDQVKMERPSDIQGLIYIPFKNDVSEARLQLAQEMNAQGITIDLSKV